MSVGVTPNLPTTIVDFRGSKAISLSLAILVGIMLVGRLGAGSVVGQSAELGRNRVTSAEHLAGSGGRLRYRTSTFWRELIGVIT